MSECIYDKCNKDAFWGIYCKKHGEIVKKINEDIIRIVIGRFCAHSQCWKQPSFTDKNCKAEFCAQHKKVGQENVNHKKCEADGCNKKPSFGYEDKKPTHCKDHIQKDQIDVIHKLCEYPKCEIRASFGKNKKIEFCTAHVPENNPEYKPIGKVMCEKDCGKRASFGFESDMIPRFCEFFLLNDLYKYPDLIVQ